MRWGTSGSEGPAWALLAGSAASPAPSHSPSPPAPRGWRAFGAPRGAGLGEPPSSWLKAAAGFLRSWPFLQAPSLVKPRATRTFPATAFLEMWSEGGGAQQSFPLPGAEHKVIIVGLDNAGKTTILYQFLMNEVVHTSPTIGSNVEEIVLRKTHFLVWDIGGQEALRSTWNTYYSNTELSVCRSAWGRPLGSGAFLALARFGGLLPRVRLKVNSSAATHQLCVLGQHLPPR
uniref:ADP-ribosylation factor-like protein 5C isoform X3 n=1 Tax=Callorhinus ursinus TaxID=34884 RepID=A0A3Q7N229_CALUR|nr:putative ADP-ribosylation factor-like protein 5C isoform X3 [Callorhinus ursinus]